MNDGSLMALRTYFKSGATRSYQFRKEQLKRLKKTLQKYEEEIFNALYTDLGKSREESYASELGLVFAELS
jgi:aldehyde dehydrogenase (NAD+)